MRALSVAVVLSLLVLAAASPRSAAAAAPNLLPTITGLNDAPAVASLPMQFNLGLLNDADGNGPWLVTVTWGDRTNRTTFTMRTEGTLPASWHTYMAPGDYVVVITATDGAGGAGSGTFTVHVPANLPPTITGVASKPAVAGAAVQFDLGLLNDPDGNGPWYTTVDWGDRSRPTTFIMRNGGVLPALWHTYAQPGSYPVTVTATDAAGGVGSATFVERVPENKPPTITGVNDKPAVAGLPARFDLGLLNDPDGNGPWQLSVDWGDQSRAVAFTMTAGGPLPASWHTYARPGGYTVTITAIDATGGIGRATFTARVPENIPPTITGLNDKPVVAGLAARFDLGILNDPDGNGPWSVSVSWGDGSTRTTMTMRTSGSLPQSEHTYAGPGDYTVTITATDAAGGRGTGTFTAHVPPNIAPTITGLADRPALIGVPAQFNLGVLEDADGNGPWSVSIDWGDGTKPVTITRRAGLREPTGGALPPSWHTYAASADYRVTITATDRAGGVGHGMFTVHVPPNIAPTITGVHDLPAVAGQPSRLDLGTLVDPDGNGPWAVVVDWGDGSKHATFTMRMDGALPPLWHTYMTSGDYLVTIRVTDTGGGIGVGTFVVTVPHNHPPAVTGLNDQPASAGWPRRFDLGMLTDADGNGPWRISVNWGDQTVRTTFSMPRGGALPSTWHVFAASGDYAVVLTATDAAGGADTGTFTVHVPENIVPMVTGLADQSATTGLPLRFGLGTLTDADGNGPWKVSVDWGDGTRVTTFTMQSGGALPQTWHTFARSGNYLVTIRVTDAAGGVGSGTFTVVVPANRAPTITDTLDRFALAGKITPVLLGTLDDADGNGPWSISVDWGDSRPRTTFVMHSLGVLPRTTHTFDVSGTYTITVTATDAAGAIGQGSFTISAS